MKNFYKIYYQDNMKGYYLDKTFKSELKAYKYIEENNLNNGYTFFNVEKITKQKGL